jgi:SAM-dependent methyltransferase
VRSTDCDGLYWDGRHYDLQHKGFDEDIPFYLGKARQYGDPVLELACGTGRITIPLAQEGVRMTGLDVSRPMLDRARQKAASERLEVEWINADCRDFELSKKFNLIFLPFNSIAHLHDLESIEACLGCVRKHLTAKGRFVIDIFNPRLDILIRDAGERYPAGEYPDPDGRGDVVITESNAYDAGAQVNRIKWYFRIGDGGTEFVKDLNMRIFFPQELDALLRYNGFMIEAKYGDFDESPFGSASAKQIPVCFVSESGSTAGKRYWRL